MKKSVVLLLTFACIICLAACNVSTEHGKSVENVTAAPSGVITTDTPSPLTTEALTSCPTLNFFDKMGLKAEVSERIMESKGEDNEYCYHMLMNTLLSFVHVPCSDRKVTERRLYSCWTKYYISVGLTLSS